MSQSYRGQHAFASLTLASQKVQITSLTTSTSLGNSHSGDLIVFSSTSGTTLSLPSPVSGLQYEFVVGATAASHSIVAPSASIVGNIMIAVGNTNGSSLHTSSATSITTTAGSAVGDSVKLKCDGTKWFVSGSVNLLNAFVYA